MRRARGALALGLLATVAAVLTATGGANALTDEVTGTVDGVQVRGDELEFVVTAPVSGTTGGQGPTDVVVTIGGTRATTSAATATGDLVERRLVLLIDTSGSMSGGGMDAAKGAAGRLVAEVAPDVQVGLVAFDEVPRVLVAPTTDRASLVAATAALSAQHETALYDGVATGLDLLGAVGDRTLVVLSDGGDTVSRTTLSAVQARLTESGVRAEVIGFRTDESQDAVLQTLAAAGHGRVTTAQDPAGLAQAFSAVASSISQQIQVVAGLPPGISGDQVVEVAATVGGDRLTATTVVKVPAVGAGGGSTTAAPLERTPTAVLPGVPLLLATPWPLAALVALLALLVVVLVVPAWVRRAPPTRLEQVELYGVSGPTVSRAAPVGPQRPQRGRAVLELARAVVRRRGLEEGHALLLDRADLPLRPSEYLVLRCSGALAVTAAAVLLLDHWLLVAVAPVLGWAAVTGYVRWRARRRVAQFAAQLPDALSLVASSLQTGFSLNQALDAVARDAADPLRANVSRAMAESRLGSDLEDALERVARRMDCEDLSWAVMAIRIQRQVGGNLAETLRTTTATLRERASLRRQVSALSADGRLSAYVLIGLPPAVVLGMLVVSPEYISGLWTQTAGLLAVAAAAVGMVVGTVWIRRLVKVDL